MRTLTLKIAAGSQEQIGATGDYVRVRLAPYDVLIENTQTGEIVEASQGDDFQLSPFTELRITNLGGVDAVFKVTIATGKKAGSAPAVLSGSVAITNAIALDAATLAALESLDLNAATLNLLRYESYGASYRSITALAANTPETVFTPAANVNGAIIHAASFQSGNAGAPNGVAFLAKASAPANVTDGDAIVTADFANYFTSVGVFGGSLKRPLKIPAGKGLYFIAQVAESSASRGVLYTLL